MGSVGRKFVVVFFVAAVKRTAELSMPSCDFVGFRYAPDNLRLLLVVRGSGWKTAGAM